MAKKTLQDILRDAQRAMKETRDAKAAEGVWREYAGRRGVFSERLRAIGKLPHVKRAEAGKAIHAARERFEQLAQRRLGELKKDEARHIREHERIDVTLPVKGMRQGTLHPLTMVRRKVEEIFHSLGFSVAEGPEVEDAQHNFDALNIPENHPARDLWDTFWLKSTEGRSASGGGPKAKTRSSLLLRTHTSPVQIRYMETHQLPFRIIVPGETYRYEATDASHEIQFAQVEGLMVDRRKSQAPVTMATLISVLTLFFERFFGKTVALRVRPSYFPFTEPSIEVDLSCVVCGGSGKAPGRKSLPAGRQGCSVCSQTGWLEMLGAGMVHPNVFKAVGYNPNNVQGFAFGFGIDRLAMLKYRIPDVRLFRSGDVRFLQQFRT